MLVCKGAFGDEHMVFTEHHLQQQQQQQQVEGVRRGLGHQVSLR
jgi:hypothetical protein